MIGYVILGAVGLFLLWWQRRHLFQRQQEELARQRRGWEEEAREKQREIEAQSRQRQLSLFNSMMAGVILLDPQGRVQFINESLRKGFGILTDVRGQSLMEVFRWHELAALSVRLEKERNVADVELESQRGGRKFWHISGALVSDRQGEPAGQIFVFHDVSRLKELENIRKDFVGNVSHELRTPLSLIKGFAQTLLDGAKDDPEQSVRFLQKIDNHSDRLLFLIEDLLAISRLESGQIALNVQHINLHDTAQRVVDDLKEPAGRRRTVLENKIPAEISIWADADRLQQVFFNLTENAIKYGKSDGHVTVEAREVDGKAEVIVADDGPGIPPEAIGRVFERFYRVDRARSRESGGTGLGLAIVKHIVQAHGGEAGVKSDPGKGASFYFTLPKQAHPGAKQGAV